MPPSPSPASSRRSAPPPPSWVPPSPRRLSWRPWHSSWRAAKPPRSTSAQTYQAALSTIDESCPAIGIESASCRLDGTGGRHGKRTCEDPSRSALPLRSRLDRRSTDLHEPSPWTHPAVSPCLSGGRRIPRHALRAGLPPPFSRYLRRSPAVLQGAHHRRSHRRLRLLQRTERNAHSGGATDPK